MAKSTWRRPSTYFVVLLVWDCFSWFGLGPLFYQRGILILWYTMVFQTIAYLHLCGNSLRKALSCFNMAMPYCTEFRQEELIYLSVKTKLSTNEIFSSEMLVRQKYTQIATSEMLPFTLEWQRILSVSNDGAKMQHSRIGRTSGVILFRLNNAHDFVMRCSIITYGCNIVVSLYFFSNASIV